ncbi:hypothetical protein [Maricaulis salignorans]|uniref:Uncharacterized protein n=1 Tax=Maricaulis salignorans TaxID=144026 RepID=A0A1G9SFD1_9PROT|nr:hypothetical protein [Maricaulis salignorans]SDM34050.1 hypothetical protein SAMN04488568_10984 [Maricaulis salignorans]
MTEKPHTQSAFFATGAGRIARDVLAAMIALAFIGAVVFMAVMLTAVFLIIAGAGLVTFGVYWLWTKVRGRRERKGPEILVATRGPDGWTVDGLGS